MRIVTCWRDSAGAKKKKTDITQICEYIISSYKNIAYKRTHRIDGIIIITGGFFFFFYSHLAHSSERLQADVAHRKKQYLRQVYTILTVFTDGIIYTCAYKMYFRFSFAHYTRRCVVRNLSYRVENPTFLVAERRSIYLWLFFFSIRLKCTRMLIGK